MKGIKQGVWAVSILIMIAVAACDNSPKYDTNLLKNPSFEKVGRDGIPKDWKLVLFLGSPDDPTVTYGVDTLAQDGKRSWYFRGDPGTRRWYLLQQEVKVVGAGHARVRGWIQGDDVHYKAEQYAMCNFLLTFYDKDHHRFQVERRADRRTPLRPGTFPWEEQSYTFPVPDGTHYIAVSCVLGMNGQAWFDNVSLEIPKPTPWETQTTRNYVFHWLPGHPMPQGAVQHQQQLFDVDAAILGVKSDVVINYFFYPDSLTIRKMNSIKGDMYVSWDDYELHTIRPYDDHELIHFITDRIGRPPRSLAEGTVLWVQNQEPNSLLDQHMRMLVKADKVTDFISLFDYNTFARTDPKASIPTAAALVKYLEEKWGKQKLMDLYASVNGMNSYQTVSKGFEAVYGEPMDKTEANFKLWLLQNYRSK
ncbi:MAG TPA: hypothetical protein VFH88_11545 [Candidatus Krumholzibacteria bacterium]|nr:hypothetical protein [Candidatus Krumholzibacteria bacterium]